MALTTDLMRSLRQPRAVLRGLGGGERREGRILMYLMLACFLIFVAQAPRLSRDAHLDPSVPLDARLAGALFAWIFVAPLLFYVLAGLLTLVLRLAAPIPGFAVRLAVFWALLVASPLILLHGLVAGLIGPGAQSIAAAMPAMLAFVMVLIAGLRVGLESPFERASA